MDIMIVEFILVVIVVLVVIVLILDLPFVDAGAIPNY